MKARLTVLIIISVLIFASCGAPAAAETAQAASFGENDLVFVLDGTGYPLNSDVVPLLEALGDGYTETAAISCVYEGDDKTFDYTDIVVYTNPIGGKDIYYLIEIFGGDYQTAKGIKVGSTLDEVKAAYGGGGFDVDSAYVYFLSGDKDDLKSPQLAFELEGGKVTAISFYDPSNIR